MAKIKELDRQQTYMLHTINWMEVASGLDATVMDADFDRGTCCVLGKDSRQFRDRLKKIMRRCDNA